MALECFFAIRTRSWVQIYRPTLFVAVVLAFYTLIGPCIRGLGSVVGLKDITAGNAFIELGLNHRPMLLWGWMGALVFYASLLVGYHGFPSLMKPARLLVDVDYAKLCKTGQSLCWLGLILYGLFNISAFVFIYLDLSFHASAIPLDSRQWFAQHLAKFADHAINLLIPGVLIQFSTWLRERSRLWVVVSWFSVASLVFVTDNLRYRILLLLVPAILIWFFYYKRRSRLILILLFSATFIAVNIAVGFFSVQTRSTQPVSIVRPSRLQVLSLSYQESGVFLTTSAVIYSVPTVFPYIASQALSDIMTQGVSSILSPRDSLRHYSDRVRAFVYRTNNVSATAYLNYAEYYLICGWPMVIASGLLIGWLLARLWQWFLWRQYEPIAQAVYLLNASFIYAAVSRGYIPSLIGLYALCVLPINLVYWRLSKPAV